VSRPWLRRIRRVMRMAAPIFTEPAPVVVSIDPEEGLSVGGVPVDVIGTGFQSGATVHFNSTLADNVAFVSSTLITCDTPALAGLLSVKVTNPDGQSDTLFDAYTALTPPNVTSVSPSTGTELGGTSLTINGSDFVSGATVTIGGAAATGVAFVNSTQLTCVAPAGAAGARDVVVTNPDTQSDTLVGGYTYFSVNPANMALTGWWRGAFASSPWSGTASAGTSGSNALTESTNPPAVGATLNGIASADFDGTNDQLNAAGTLDTYISATAFSGWCLCQLDSNTAGELFVRTGGGTQFNLYISTTVRMRLTSTEAVHAIPTGTWVLVTFRYDGANIQIGVNEYPGADGGTSSVAFSSSITMTGTMGFSQNNIVGRLNGRIIDFGITDSALSNEHYDGIFSYINTRYGLAVGTFPSTLAVEGWWRASYSASPWVGTESAAASSGRNLTEGTNPPATGSAINSLVTADFDGTNDRLNGAACSTFMTVSAYSGWALVNLDAINTNNTSNYFLNDIILATTGTAEWCVYLRSSGPTVGVTNTNAAGAAAAISTGGWALVQFRFGSGTTEIRVNSGSWVTASQSNVSSLAANLAVGDCAASGFLDGRIADIGLLKTRLDDTAFNNLKSYINSRYGLSL
jgi:hypothetical protein